MLEAEPGTKSISAVQSVMPMLAERGLQKNLEIQSVNPASVQLPSGVRGVRSPLE